MWIVDTMQNHGGAILSILILVTFGLRWFFNTKWWRQR